MSMARLLVSIVVAAAGCQQPAKSTENPPAKAERPAAPESARFESPQAVYKQYAEALRAARWSDAIALFSPKPPKGKTGLALANFKALALLAGNPHPTQEAYKAVLHDFCQAHSLRCADASWNTQFTPALLAQGNVTDLLSDVAALAAAKPEATYVEVMKLLEGVDSSKIVPLDPTLSDVIYTENTATGLATRADGQKYTMSFESSAERGWMIVE